MHLFYENIERGLGEIFRDHIIGEIDKLEENAGIDEQRLGYYFRPENRFHQGIYYKMNGQNVVVWRILDMRFNPKRITNAIRG